MGNLLPAKIGEIAFAAGSGVEMMIDPTGSAARLELWERSMKFNAPPTAFSQIGIFSSTQTVNQTVPMGGLYQAQIFRENEGPNGARLGELSFPGLKSEEGRTNFCTRCAEVPQVDVTRGGTFVSMAFATSAMTRARVQLGAKPPQDRGDGFPAFAPADVVATAVSDQPKIMHKVELMDRLLDPETTLHTPLRSGQELFFVILAWDALGNWDYVWDVQKAAPGSGAKSFKTKDRRVDTRIKRLYCWDDSDSSTFGEGSFKFIVQGKTGPPVTKSLAWGAMDSKTFHADPATPTEVTVSGSAANGPVTVRVTGFEDDSGTPFDENDTSAAPSKAGSEPLPFPVGQANEAAKKQVLTLNSVKTGGDDTLGFWADIEYDVSYF
ncbi:hypothetical protein ACIRBY_25165 [Streptomyces sp. NPDC096136]|uniref:hypothetical protein n=1 Tax=Streptomyces sp. NPDC096136 TaxID=3366076 RepID=UPI00381B669B